MLQGSQAAWKGGQEMTRNEAVACTGQACLALSSIALPKLAFYNRSNMASNLA